MPKQNKKTHEIESQIEIGETCPSKHHLYRVVPKLELENDFPEETLAGCPDAMLEGGGVERGKERAVEPATTLGDEFGDLEDDTQPGKRRYGELTYRRRHIG
jgi:hypothetical protein